MTREEAIYELMNTHKYFYEDKRLDEAIDMAISALNEADKREQYGQNYESGSEVRLAVVNRYKDRVILFDPFGEEEYLPPSADRPTVVHCRECVRKKNCWMFDEHKDDNGTCVWAEPYYITESPNEVVETDDDVIESVRCKDCEWFKNCEYFKKPPCRPKHTEPSDLISRADAIEVFIDWGMKEFGFHDLNRNERFIDALSALPSAERVVRCKDCYHSSWNKYSESLDCYFFADGDVEDDDFCSRAKMKGGTE